ncbi:MAG: translocase [Planctomycetales bacterium]|nr:translocase [Planctomycetales bacterium]
MAGLIPFTQQVGWARPWRLGTELPRAFRMARCQELLRRINRLEAARERLTNDQLRKESLALRYRAKSGEPLDHLLVEAFALVREAARRAIGMRHYDVQMLGGIVMHRRAIVEMQTGEGKTLTATLPMYLAALAGHGAHLATANDYLARRDAELMGPVYRLLGISVGVVAGDSKSTERRAAYECDVCYGTAKEFGFDFLRDRLIQRQLASQATDVLGRMLGVAEAADASSVVGRDLHFILVDEADSLLIDEARTPLVISAPSATPGVEAALYAWAAQAAPSCEENLHFTVDRQKRKTELTQAGRRLARELPHPETLAGVGLFTIYEFLERAIHVSREMIRDRQYVVRDGEIVIVDEFTGRTAEGRRFSRGLHQAIEAKEGLAPGDETAQAARIMAQDFFLAYDRLAGMTGTAATSAAELKRIYATDVVAIPTNRPPIRQELPTRVFVSADEKWRAIADEVAQVHAQGRPVLIGVRSIDKSETLSRLLAGQGVEHEVLNAKQVQREAAIIAQAGQRGRVTVSTNMAGRGTDIRLGAEVEALGGLHVICTELHESRRIDRQLIGRCGRQGDPGTYRQYLALDDDILREGLGPQRAARLRAQGKDKTSLLRFVPIFHRAQRLVERARFRDRRLLLYAQRERRRLQEELGLDPYLDAAE